MPPAPAELPAGSCLSCLSSANYCSSYSGERFAGNRVASSSCYCLDCCCRCCFRSSPGRSFARKADSASCLAAESWWLPAGCCWTRGSTAAGCSRARREATSPATSTGSLGCRRGTATAAGWSVVEGAVRGRGRRRWFDYKTRRRS